MRVRTAIWLLLVLLCPGAARSAPPDFAIVRDRVFSRLLEWEPALGRDLGRHAFDGRVADYSATGLEKQITWLREEARELAAVDAAALSSDESLDLALLKQRIAARLFDLTVMEAPHKRASFYSELFDVSVYLDDRDRPLEGRARSVLAHEKAAVEQAGHVLENLKAPLSNVTSRMEAASFEGYATYLRTEVAGKLKGVLDRASEAEGLAANGLLADRAEAISKALAALAASGDDSHILGPARYQQFLRDEEGIQLTAAELKALGENDLAKNAQAYEALAKTTHFTRPKLEEILPAARRMLADARQFIVEHHIVTIPPDEHPVLVAPPQSFKRWANGYLGGSGKSATFYVGVPDPSWPKAKQLEYIAPNGELHNGVAHEVYPGHFIQALWADQAPTQIQAASFNTVFNEGWAHYAEQMMLEEGFGADVAENRLGQVSAALRRDCRVLASVGVHTEGMTVADAEHLFIDRCHLDPTNAHMEAERATFDPGYFQYTVGKLQILALRDEAKHLLGKKFSLQQFHDALLRHGRPPIALLREPVLRELGALPASSAAH